MLPKIFIDGEHGTTGLQIRNRLAARRDLDVLSIPEAERRNNAMRADFLKQADIAILCLPDEAAREAVQMLDGVNSTRLIDTSTAHRTHPDWVYGFAEMETAQKDRIAGARLVANPGCYPTGAVALIRPLVAAGILPSDYPVTVNAVSGYTGGGKQLIAQMEDEKNPGHIAAPHFLYGLTLHHKHVPEMQQHAGLTHAPLFSPAVINAHRGMVVEVPLPLSAIPGAASVDAVDIVKQEKVIAETRNTHAKDTVAFLANNGSIFDGPDGIRDLTEALPIPDA